MPASNYLSTTSRTSRRVFIGDDDEGKLGGVEFPAEDSFQRGSSVALGVTACLWPAPDPAARCDRHTRQLAEQWLKDDARDADCVQIVTWMPASRLDRACKYRARNSFCGYNVERAVFEFTAEASLVKATSLEEQP